MATRSEAALLRAAASVQIHPPHLLGFPSLHSYGLLDRDSQDSDYTLMGVFSTRIKVRNFRGGPVRSILALVNPGSTLPWIPRQIAEDLKVRETDRAEFETTASVIRAPLTNDVSYVIDGREASFPTAIGQEGSRPILGAIVLEGLNLQPDPSRKRLVKRRAYYAYFSSRRVLTGK